MALSKTCPETYESSRTFLEGVSTLFKTMVVDDGKWKPYQTAVIACTTSILALSDDILGKEKFGFFLTSRISQDSLENTFSMIRSKNPTPTAREFKYNLRAICAAQYLKEKKTASYEHDEASYLLDCLGNLESDKERNGEDDVEEFVSKFTPNGDSAQRGLLDISEENSLYYFAGYVIQSVLKLHKSCEQCVEKFRASDRPQLPEQSLLKLRAFNEDCLFKCSENSHRELFLPAEAILRSFSTETLLKTRGICSKLQALFKQNQTSSLRESCHDLESPIIYRFYKARLHFISKEEKRKNKDRSASDRASKSTEMRRLVKQV